MTKGMPRQGSERIRGNAIVDIVVKIPNSKDYSPNEKKMLKTLLAGLGK